MVRGAPPTARRLLLLLLLLCATRWPAHYSDTPRGVRSAPSPPVRPTRRQAPG